MANPGALDDIVTALAPAAALTSGIFFANGLQQRFSLISQRVRDLNSEARGLAPGPRLVSVRSQVKVLFLRASLIHRAILLVYGGMLSLIGCVIELLMTSFFDIADAPGVTAVTFATFSLGLLLVALAFLQSTAELRLATQTLREDVRSSFTGEDEKRPEA